jgi:mannosyltransferase
MIDRSPPRAPAREWQLLGALALLALVVRIPGIGGDLWLDEIATLLDFVRPPLAQIMTSYETPNNHVLYSVLGHLSITAFGETSWALRLPALLFGAASVPALYYFAARWLPRREALAGALILAVSYHHAYFSQNARGYTGFMLLTLLSASALVAAIDSGRRRYWAAFAVLTATNIYMLLSGLFATAAIVLGAFVLFVLPAEPGRRGRLVAQLSRWLGVAAALTLAAYAPLLGPMLEAFTRGDTDVGWLPSLELLRIMLRDAVPGGAPVLVALLLVGLPILALGGASLARRAPFVYFVLALPPAIEMSAALALGAGTYPRRFLLLLPLLILIAVRGVAVASELLFRNPVWRRRAFTAAVAAGALASAAALPRLYTMQKQDYTGALAYIERHRSAEDLLAAAYIATTSMALYAPEARSARTEPDLRALLDEGRTVWLVGTLLPDMRRREPGLMALIDDRFHEEASFPGLVGDGAVHVWRSR